MRKSRTTALSKRTKTKKRLMVGIVSLSAMVAVTSSLSFADVDLKGKVKSWADKTATNAITTLDTSIAEESQRQQDRLKEELQAALDAQAAELQTYTDEQKQKYIQAIRDYADQLLSSQTFSTQEDEQQISAKLDQILSSAEAAMSSLADSYVPPKLSYEAPPEAPATDGKDGKGEEAKGGAAADHPVKETPPAEDGVPAKEGVPGATPGDEMQNPSEPLPAHPDSPAAGEEVVPPASEEPPAAGGQEATDPLPSATPEPSAPAVAPEQPASSVGPAQPAAPAEVISQGE